MRRRYSAAEKEAAVQRVAAGEAVGSVARRQGIDPKRLYEWYGKYQAGGREPLQASRRPPSMPTLGPDRPPWSGKVSAVSANVPPVFAIANRLRKPLVSLALPEHFTFS